MLIIILKVGQIERSLTTNFGSRLAADETTLCMADGSTVCKEFTGALGALALSGYRKLVAASRMGLTQGLYIRFPSLCKKLPQI